MWPHLNFDMRPCLCPEQKGSKKCDATARLCLSFDEWPYLNLDRGYLSLDMWPCLSLDGLPCLSLDMWQCLSFDT